MTGPFLVENKASVNILQEILKRSVSLSHMWIRPHLPYSLTGIFHFLTVLTHLWVYSEAVRGSNHLQLTEAPPEEPDPLPVLRTPSVTPEGENGCHLKSLFSHAYLWLVINTHFIALFLPDSLRCGHFGWIWRDPHYLQSTFQIPGN